MRAEIPDDRLIKIFERASPECRNKRLGRSKGAKMERESILSMLVPEV